MILLDYKGHLVSTESEEELHSFAHKIGLKREWYQGENIIPAQNNSVFSQRKTQGRTITPMDGHIVTMKCFPQPVVYEFKETK